MARGYCFSSRPALESSPVSWLRDGACAPPVTWRFALCPRECLRTGALTREPTGATKQASRDAAANTNRPMEVNVGSPTYMGSADPARSRTDYADYYPAWLDNLADDVTVEGSLLDGAAQGAEAVRTIVGTIRTFYEHQEFNFAGPYGDNGFLEDYTARVRGEPIGCAVLITSNAAGQTQHVAANYRPRSSLLLLSRLLGEKFAGTPYAEYFLASES